MIERLLAATLLVTAAPALAQADGTGREESLEQLSEILGAIDRVLDEYGIDLPAPQPEESCIADTGETLRHGHIACVACPGAAGGSRAVGCVHGRTVTLAECAPASGEGCLPAAGPACWPYGAGSDRDMQAFIRAGEFACVQLDEDAYILMRCTGPQDLFVEAGAEIVAFGDPRCGDRYVHDR
jgi:hypothetical protein